MNLNEIGLPEFQELNTSRGEIGISGDDNILWQFLF